MRKKIIGMSVVVALLAMLYAQSVAAQPVLPSVYAWTDKPEYKPGETGTLKITILNEEDTPVEVKSISIKYPWYVYNGKTGKWEGNATVTEGLPKWINPGDVYYTEVEFTIPTDGRVHAAETIEIKVKAGEEQVSKDVPLRVSTTSVPMTIEGLETWMTSLTAAIIVCTIILAIVVLLATRKTRAPRALVPRAPAPPPPPKSKPKPKPS